jgi:tellurium resistance protein TerZ
MINLTKGSSINLVKNEKQLETIKIGLNWGKIKKGGMFGMFTESENVDLDASVVTFSKGQSVETIYFGNKTSRNGSIRHSGDDTTGDDTKDDFDNETIIIDLKRVDENIDTIVVFLNSYKGQQFDTIPYSKIRIIEKNEVFADFNLSSQKEYVGKVSMIMGKLTKDRSGWLFKAIGEPLNINGIDNIVKVIKESYL